MKRVISCLLSSSILVGPMVHAQTSPSIIPIVTGGNKAGGSNTIITGQGNTNINTQDTTKLLGDIFARNVQIQESDRQYMEQTVSKINAEYLDLMKYITTGEFMNLSIKSKSGSVPAEQFLTSVNKINEMKTSLEANIFALTTIANSLPSALTMNVNGIVQNVSGLRQIDTSKLVNFYNEKLKALITTASNYGFKVAFPNIPMPQVIEENKGEALTFKFDIPLFTTVQLANMADLIKALNTDFVVTHFNPDTYEVQIPNDLKDIGLTEVKNNYARQLRQLIYSFVSNYGTQEKWRFHTDAEKAARADAYNKIAEMFWARSYLRLKYAAPMGAIQTAQYKKAVLNLDVFKMQEALTTMREETAFTEKELQDASESMRNVLASLGAMSGEKNKWDWSHIFVSVLDRANEFKTFVTGNTPVTQALFMVMGLVATDIQEEREMLSGGGLAKVKALYSAKYQANAEAVASTTLRKCNYDVYFKQNNAEACKQKFGDSQVTNAGSIRGLFNDFNNKMVAKSQDYSMALKIQAKMAAAALSGQSLQDANDRSKDL